MHRPARLRPDDLRSGHHPHAIGSQDAGHPGRDLRLLLADQLIGGFDQGDPNSEGRVGLGELAADRSAAEHDERLGIVSG